MSDALQSLSATVDRIHEEYRRNFAGRSRFTRDLTVLDKVLSDTRAAIAIASVTEGADDLAATLRERSELYQAEREKIAAIQKGGPDEAIAWLTDSWSRLTYRRYGRLFGGQNRVTRDLGLLQEMATDQRRWRDELRAAAVRHDAGWHNEELVPMDRNVDLYEGEVGQIKQARANLSPNDRARALASEANLNFTSWRTNFQDKPRNSRRAALLRRMIASLDRIQTEMLAVQALGVSDEFHTNNIKTVTNRIPGWKAELQKIEEAQAMLLPDQVGGLLGEDANRWFARYRAEIAGKPRADVELATLGEICDGLHEVGLAMESLHRRNRKAGNEKNLGVVTDNLKAYEREWERVRDAQVN